MSTLIKKDVIILGGGIAGLWLLNRLRNEGYSAALLESQRLGAGQTIASQGMIHGGIKYALSGMLTGASDAIADMPQQWKACLEGRGAIDLRGTRLLSTQYYLWPRHSFRSRLNAFFGSKTLRGRVAALPAEQFPAFCRDRIGGPLYQLTDLVVDIPSLLQVLSQTHAGHIHKIDWDQAHLSTRPNGEIECLQVNTGTGQTRLKAQRYVLTAGAGTEALLARFQLDTTAMQRRPLHMVMVKHRIADPIYVHCVDEHLGSTPELTITTHPCKQGWVWYLGGELAESGVGLPQAEQVARAAAKLSELLPWYDLSAAQWSSFHIDRAEPQQPMGGRPDKAFVRNQHNFLVCWPTKLSLAPNLADEVLQEFARHGIAPVEGNGEDEDEQPAIQLPFPGIAMPPWDAHFS